MLKRGLVLGVAALALAVACASSAGAATLRDKWCSNVHLRFFVGGAEGDAFGSIVYNGAKQAEHDLGPTVDYVFSGWAPEKMTQQLREAVAAHPDGIAMMGHPGEAAIMPLAEQASKAGIKMMYQNVPLPGVVAKFGGGYVGAQQAPQGKALAEDAIKRFGLKSGDKVIVFGPFDQQPERYVREGATADAFSAAGLVVTRSDDSFSRAFIRSCDASLPSSSTTITWTFGVVSCCPPKITAKIEKNASGNTKLSTNAPRSRFSAIKAVLAILRINRVAPFRSGAETRFPGSAGAETHPPAPGPL